ncbi:MAG: 50S ribosomal protein L21 [Cytophagaceae bacterium]
MYAIVKIGGKQYKAEKDQYIYTNRLEGKEGSSLELDVLLLGGEDKIEVGTPTVKGAKVSAKILSHVKDNKVIVFHKKRRKGYQKSNGHRQYLTKVLIEKITK